VSGWRGGLHSGLSVWMSFMAVMSIISMVINDKCWCLQVGLGQMYR
jgi:hypothetical protein